MGGKRKTQIVKVTDLALDRPDLSAAEIGREIGLSKSRVSGILKLPGAAKRVRARLAEGNPIGRATAGIATILATLETLIEETLASPDGLDRDDVADLMTYLAALTGTLDRLGRTGIQLDTVVQTDDDAQLTILILEAWAGQSPGPPRVNPSACYVLRASVVEKFSQFCRTTGKR
ncbi:MAG: hypothetical protein ACYS7Y_36240 [Planctomycetota bacterium]|jgi:hypothetical protein